MAEPISCDSKAALSNALMIFSLKSLNFTQAFQQKTTSGSTQGHSINNYCDKVLRVYVGLMKLSTLQTVHISIGLL